MHLYCIQCPRFWNILTIKLIYQGSRTFHWNLSWHSHCICKHIELSTPQFWILPLRLVCEQCQFTCVLYVLHFGAFLILPLQTHLLFIPHLCTLATFLSSFHDIDIGFMESVSFVWYLAPSISEPFQIEPFTFQECRFLNPDAKCCRVFLWVKTTVSFLITKRTGEHFYRTPVPADLKREQFFLVLTLMILFIKITAFIFVAYLPYIGRSRVFENHVLWFQKFLYRFRLESLFPLECGLLLIQFQIRP